MAPLTDYHCHLLPGIDDGPSSIKESVAMARLLLEAGYDTVYCTPHMIKGLYEVDNNTVKKGINELQRELNKEGIALRLLSGREYYLDNYFKELLDDLMPLENTSYLLIEIPPHTYPGMVQDSISAILRKNLIPMLAHPERCELFHDRQIAEPVPKKTALQSLLQRLRHSNQPAPDAEIDDNALLNWLIDKRCAFQSNLPSFQGAYGDQILATARKFDSFGIYTHSGTDAHTPECLEKLFRQKAI